MDSTEADFPTTEEAGAFFAAIIRHGPTATKPASTAISRLRIANGKDGSAKKEDEEVFRIGDTVLVDTQARSFPSVGVIVALWQPCANNHAELGDTDIGDGDDGDVKKHKDKWWARTDVNSQPSIRIHWFVQPSELPEVRAPRDHAAVSIFHFQHFHRFVLESHLVESE